MADKGKDDPQKLPKFNPDFSVDSEANGGASARNLDLPTGIRGIRPERIAKDTKKAGVSQQPSEN